MVNYKIIQDVRFDERISETDVSTILRALEEPLNDHTTDIKTRLEHQLVGGSSSFKPPLTPYAFLAGMDVEQVNQQRANYTRYGQAGEFFWNKGSVVTASPEARKELYQRIHEASGKELFDSHLDLYELKDLCHSVRYGKEEVSPEQKEIADAVDASGLGDIRFWFAMSPLDSQTGKTGLPYVSRIVIGDTTITDREFLDQFKLKTPLEDDGVRSYLKGVDKGIKAFIDEDGYRFEVVE